jgi:transposase InsO family protein
MSDEEPETPITLDGDYQKKLNLALLWHRRLGHLGLKLLKKTTIITKSLPDFSAIKDVDFRCTECTKGKMVRRGPKKPILDPPNVLDILEGDTFKINPVPVNKRPVGLIIIDRKSRYRWVFLLKNRDGGVVFDTVKGFFKLLKNQYNRYPKLFHYDEGTEINSELRDWLAAKGIHFNTSSPYIHEQNGLVERSIRVLLDRLRTTFLASSLPQHLWCYILPAVLELVNKTAVTNRDYTPFQLFFDELEPEIQHTPDLKPFRIIGSACEVLIPHENRPKSQKLLQRTESARLLAVLGTKTYLVYIPTRQVVLKTSFIRFLEDPFNGQRPINSGGVVLGDTIPISPNNSNPRPNPVPILPEISEIPPKIPEITEDTGGSVRMDVDYVRRLTNKVKWDTFYVNSTVPKTYKQALKSPEKDLWLEAIKRELDQIITKHVFSFIPAKSLPKGRKVITSRWVLTQKPSKKKARLVIRGFQQVEGLDYNETFASTSAPPTWRVLLALAASLDLEIEQIDFIGAFLNGDLEEDIFVEIPEGLLELFNELTLKTYNFDPSEPQIIHLKKALYGLKQAPKQWQDKVQGLLRKEGFYPLISDTAVYFNIKKGIYIVTHVDDCLLIGPSITEINSLKRRLNGVYAIEDLGPASLFLGVRIRRNRSKRLLWLDQKHYIKEALTLFNLVNLKSATIPLQPNVLVANNEGDPVNTADHKLYQQIIGTIMYLMIQTRPDISFPVQWLSRALQKPYKTHLNAAKALLRYLNHSVDLAICYGREDFNLLGYADSDFAGCKITAKSTYGYLYKVAGGPISWKAKRGTTISLSTLEAEFIALTEATKEAQWLVGLFSELLIPNPSPVILHGDNTGSNTTAYNSSYHNRTKHTLLRFQYVKEKVLEGLIKVIYIDTNSMPADGLTKPLLPQKQKVFLTLLGLEALKS